MSIWGEIIALTKRQAKQIADELQQLHARSRHGLGDAMDASAGEGMTVVEQLYKEFGVCQ